MVNIDKKKWWELYQTALKNPIQAIMLSNYSLEEIIEMETKIVFIKNKYGKIKIGAMAIKNAIDYETEEIKIDENGEPIKEATGLFSIDIKEIEPKLLDSIFTSGNKQKLIKEPKNWGENGEPNIVLSVLQREIFEHPQLQNHRIEGSNFGTFLKDSYTKMGKEETVNYEYDTSYLISIEEKTKYLNFMKFILVKEFKELNSGDISLDYETMQILNKEKLIEKEKVQYIHTKYLKYYETVLNKNSEEYKKFKELMDKLYLSNNVKKISSKQKL